MNLLRGPQPPFGVRAGESGRRVARHDDVEAEVRGEARGGNDCATVAAKPTVRGGSDTRAAREVWSGVVGDRVAVLMLRSPGWCRVRGCR